MGRRAAIAIFLAVGTLAGGVALRRQLGAWRARLTPPLAALAEAPALLRLGARAEPRTKNLADFDSGNIGAVARTGPYSFELSLRSDNDEDLPEFWRQWFYLRLDDVPTDRAVTLTLKGLGPWGLYLPFYSYDDQRWTQAATGEVSHPAAGTLVVTRRFQRSTVWLARYAPYTYAHLRNWLSELRRQPHVLVSQLGLSPEGRVIPILTISEPFRSADKRRVVIHARTHPGEVGSSFVLEGLVRYLLGSSATAARMRQRLIFTIVPMLNVDGVVAGNNRVTPTGINLEGKWHEAGDGGLSLDPARTPPEVQMFHDHLVALLRQKVPVTMALNLHSSGGEPEDGVFAFPHFGPEERGYGPEEARLFAQQSAFVKQLKAVHGAEWFGPLPVDGTRAFLRSAVPETWWWHHFRDQVTALTIEATYGRSARGRNWVQPEDLRRLGASLGRAIAKSHGLD